ncbi:MAG: methyltransferase domain-containing protein [Gemmatimonadetes bacterium]|nr:methyltransferase domain-containing protein [Gemmatimonadota bacterium]
MSESASERYVMGYDDRERRRLQLQAAIINPTTDQLLRRAGLRAGMRVLDIGSGVGDVALVAARIVGPTGHVTACDLDERALAVLTERATAEGITHVQTVAGDVNALAQPRTFDAATGRHILIHLADPLAMIRAVMSHVKPGGLVEFQEFDFSVLHPAYPPTPLRDQAVAIFRDFFALARHGNMGTRLPALFLQAGLAEVEGRVEYPISNGGPESPYYEWISDSLRSILPRAQAAGVTGTADLDIDTLEARLRAECVATGAVLPGPTMVGCVGRVP